MHMSVSEMMSKFMHVTVSTLYPLVIHLTYTHSKPSWNQYHSCNAVVYCCGSQFTKQCATATVRYLILSTDCKLGQGATHLEHMHLPVEMRSTWHVYKTDMLVRIALTNAVFKATST